MEYILNVTKLYYENTAEQKIVDYGCETAVGHLGSNCNKTMEFNFDRLGRNIIKKPPFGNDFNMKKNVKKIFFSNMVKYYNDF